MRHYDVFVIGGGIAGVSAALAAAAAGARVGLARRGPGTTALACGGWAGAPPPPLLRALEAAGYPLLPPRAPLPHPDGTVRRYDLAAAGHVAADGPDAGRSADDGGPAVVCGIIGLPGFRARALARLWAATAGTPAERLVHADALLEGTPAAGWAPAALAGLLDREPEALVAALRPIGARYPGHTLILPAVLGLRDPRPLLQRLADSGIAAVEALGGTPSIPGWRLDGALMASLRAAGVAPASAHAHVEAPAAGAPWRIHMEAGGARQEIVARRVVLATGGFIGGGIIAQPLLAEPAAGLSVAVAVGGGRFDSAADSLLMTAPERLARQPLLAAGVGDAGPAAGLFPAGAVRAGVEAAALGLGDAAADGWTAGVAAAAAAGSAGSWA